MKSIKKTKPKRLLSLLLTLTMALSMLQVMSITAFAATCSGSGTEADPYTPKYWDQLASLINSRSDCYIKLSNATINFSYSEHTLLNGTKVLILEGENTFKGADRIGLGGLISGANGIEGSKLIIRGDGTLNYSDGTLENYNNTSGNISIFYECNVIIESGTFKATDTSSLLFKGCNVTVNGGVFIPLKPASEGYTRPIGLMQLYAKNEVEDYYTYYPAIFKGGKVTVNGGLFMNAAYTFQSSYSKWKQNSGGWTSGYSYASLSDFTVNGGIFQFDKLSTAKDVRYIPRDRMEPTAVKRLITKLGDYGTFARGGYEWSGMTADKFLSDVKANFKDEGFEVVFSGGGYMTELDGITVNGADVMTEYESLENVHILLNQKSTVAISLKPSSWLETYLTKFSADWSSLMRAVLAKQLINVYHVESNNVSLYSGSDSPSSTTYGIGESDGIYTYTLELAPSTAGVYQVTFAGSKPFQFDRLKLSAAKEVLSGTVTLSGAYFGSLLTPTFSGNIEDTDKAGNLSYQWQISTDGKGEWSDISGATERSYTPVSGNIGLYLRLTVTDNGEDYAASNAVQVGKKPYNFTEPTDFTLYQSSSDYNTLIVRGVKATQEYLISTNATPPDRDSTEWDNAIIPDQSNTEIVDTPSGRVLNMSIDCPRDQYLFVHTRLKETDYTVAGYYTKTKSIYTGTTTAIKGISLGYSSLNMQVGDVKLIKATPIPSNAENWTGAQWYVNGTGAKLYTDAACTIPYVSSVHGSRTELYLKATEKNNNITVGAEKTVGYNSIVRGTMTVNVADQDGYFKANQLVLSDVSLYPGELTTVDISTGPNPSTIDGTLTFTNFTVSVPDTITLSGNAAAKTATVSVPYGVEPGSYIYVALVDGERVHNGFITVNVLDPEQSVPVESVTIEPEAVSLAPGMSYRFNLTVTPSNATVSGSVAWSKVSGSDSLTVDSTGNVVVADNAYGGETAEFVAVFGGKSAVCRVNVATPINQVRMSLTTPKAGEHPSAPSITVYDYGVQENSLTYKWYDTEDTSAQIDPSVTCFEAGKTYRLVMTLDARNDYIFADGIIPEISVGGGIDVCTVTANTSKQLFFSKTFTIKEETTYAAVSGQITSFGSETDDVTVQLIPYGTSVPKYEAYTSGNLANYTVEEVASGNYTIKVIKNDHVTETAVISVLGADVEFNATVYLLGDINTDLARNAADLTKLKKALLGTETVTDAEKARYDIKVDEEINLVDLVRLKKIISS